MSKFKWWVNGMEGGGLADSFAGAHAAAGEALHALGADVCEYSVAEVIHICEQDNTDDGQYDFYNLACNVLNEMDSIIGTDIFSSLCIGDVQNIGWNIELMIKSLTADNPKFYIPIAHTVRCYVYRSDEYINKKFERDHQTCVVNVMYKFKCWVPSDGDTEETSMLIESLKDDVGTAAVQFVKTVEEETSYYYVGL